MNCSQGTFGGGAVGWVHPGWSKCWTVGAASAAGGEERPPNITRSLLPSIHGALKVVVEVKYSLRPFTLFQLQV